MGQAALQAHCYAGRRRGAAAGGSGRQRCGQGMPAGVMLWAVPGVPLQCPTLTEGHFRRVVGQAALQAHCYAGRRRGAAAGGSGRQRCGQECLPV